MKPHGTPYVAPAVLTVADITSAWSWENQGATTLTQGTDGVYLGVPASAIVDLRQLAQAVPSLSYQLTVRFYYEGDDSNYRYCFAGWKDALGAAGNLQVVTHDRRNSYVTYRFDMADEKTITTAVAYHTTQLTPVMSLRVKETAGNIYMYRSMSGFGWYLVYSVAKAAGYLTTAGAGYNYLVFGAGVDTTSVATTWGITECTLENV